MISVYRKSNCNEYWDRLFSTAGYRRTAAQTSIHRLKVKTQLRKTVSSLSATIRSFILSNNFSFPLCIILKVLEKQLFYPSVSSHFWIEKMLRRMLRYLKRWKVSRVIAYYRMQPENEQLKAPSTHDQTTVNTSWKIYHWSLTSGGNYQIRYHQKCIILWK